MLFLNVYFYIKLADILYYNFYFCCVCFKPWENTSHIKLLITKYFYNFFLLKTFVAPKRATQFLSYHLQLQYTTEVGGSKTRYLFTVEPMVA